PLTSTISLHDALPISVPNQQIDPFIPWLVDNKHVKSFFLGGSDYAWPHGSLAAVKSAVSKAGGSIVGEEYSPLGSTDFSGTLRRSEEHTSELQSRGHL